MVEESLRGARHLTGKGCRAHKGGDGRLLGGDVHPMWARRAEWHESDRRCVSCAVVMYGDVVGARDHDLAVVNLVVEAELVPHNARGVERCAASR